MAFTVKFNLTEKLLISAGVIASAAAMWHLLCLFGGPSWFAFARAPQSVIDSAQQGTLFAPLATVIAASLMFACTVFAFSAVGLIGKIPLVKPALVTIALLCTVRGVIAIPFFLTSTGWDIWQVVASTVWFYVGVCFIAGSIEQYRRNKSLIIN